MEYIFRQINSRIFNIIWWAFAFGAQIGQDFDLGRIIITCGIALGLFTSILSIIRYQDKIITDDTLTQSRRYYHADH